MTTAPDRPGVGPGAGRASAEEARTGPDKVDGGLDGARAKGPDSTRVVNLFR